MSRSRRFIAPYSAARGGLAKLHDLISSPEASARMERDGVRQSTVTTYVEG